MKYDCTICSHRWKQIQHVEDLLHRSPNSAMATAATVWFFGLASVKIPAGRRQIDWLEFVSKASINQPHRPSALHQRGGSSARVLHTRPRDPPEHSPSPPPFSLPKLHPTPSRCAEEAVPHSLVENAGVLQMLRTCSLTVTSSLLSLRKQGRLCLIWTLVDTRLSCFPPSQLSFACNSALP